MRGQIKENIMAPIMRRNAQAIAFHRKIFFPSKGPNGIKLNTPKNTFTKHIKPNIVPINDSEKIIYNGNVSAAISIFVRGPAAAILPILIPSACPRICTAPGTANTKPNKIPKMSANNKPCGYMRNSAQRLYFLATNL